MLRDGASVKIIHSLAFFRSQHSAYESERCGVARGIFFDNFVKPLLAAHRAVWGKDAELVVHHDNRAMELPSFRLLTSASERGELRLVFCGEAVTLCGAMMWRLRPIYEEGVDWVVCRDLDSLPMHRDRSMIEEAMAAGADAHAILDSESHSGPMMGGMTSWRAAAFRSVVPSLPRFEEETFNNHGSDQRWLNGTLWPHVANKTFIHQRRSDIQYPQAMRTARVHPQTTPLDHVVRHIGAGYAVDRALEVLATQ